MAGYIWHIIHAYETYENLSEETKAQMSKEALRDFIMGAILPDLATGENKTFTHFYKSHPLYGESYKIPDIKKAEELFLKKNPICLGVLSHLKYDIDHINCFLLVYAKPCGSNVYINTTTGEKISGIQLWGNWKDVYGQLYELYDKFNYEMAKEFTPKLNVAFDTSFSANKDGFLTFIRWLFPENIPMSGIPEMDNYRTTDDLYQTIKVFFNNTGKDCKLTAKIDDLVTIVRKSAVELARKIDNLYV